MEAVRLVIWDLDETFWKGTLTEGGIIYNQSCHDAVVELAHRGIMNSICSKNDFDNVRSILQDSGIWDYFVFPSINWRPKGERIARIIENIQLRPSTVMLIDDNPLNLKEAQYFVPNLQVAPETFVVEMLASPLFKGKVDKKLTRLKQYKMLEAKSTDRVRAGGDNIAFLKKSDIRVSFDYDIMPKIDRIVELINRTNQLNFTKRRLPEDIDLAREEIRTLLSHYQTQAALISVVDAYGDYGYVGFYAQKRDGRGTKLIHFCFSCRTLNMGIETWVYHYLGSPDINVEGEVLIDIKNPSTIVDWIRLVDYGIVDAGKDAAVHRFDRVISHGGCDQRALAHYLTRHAHAEVGEYNISRHGLQLRTDTSFMLRHALEGLPADALPDVKAIGFSPEDFQSEICRLEGKNNLVILSFWMDSATSLLRHMATGAIVPYSRRELEERYAKEPRSFYRRACDVVATAFQPAGLIDDDDFRANIDLAIRAIGDRAKVVLIAGNARYRQKSQATTNLRVRQNAILAEIGHSYRNVDVISVESYIESESEVHSTNHFDRMVYYRMYKDIIRRVTKIKGSAAVPKRNLATARH